MTIANLSPTKVGPSVGALVKKEKVVLMKETAVSWPGLERLQGARSPASGPTWEGNYPSGEPARGAILHCPTLLKVGLNQNVAKKERIMTYLDWSLG